MYCQSFGEHLPVTGKKAKQVLRKVLKTEIKWHKAGKHAGREDDLEGEASSKRRGNLT